MANDRLSHLLYRCNSCKQLLSSHEIQATWEDLERTGATSKGICPCGGSRISPTNPTPDEYKQYGSLRQLLRHVLGKRDHGTILWTLASTPGTQLRWYERILLSLRRP